MLFESDNDHFDDVSDDPLVAERVTGLQPPRIADFCLGHTAIEKDLLSAWQAGRLPHALIFSGLEGIGKSTLSFRLARFLLKYGRGGQEDDGPGLFGEALPVTTQETLDVTPEDTVFHKVASGGHPDLLVVERPENDKGERVAALPVDVVRRINPFLQKTASEGGWRIVLVDDADTMNRSSQNAILKILEEPPAHTLIILITHRAGAMLPTIRSRCRTINLQPLSQQDFSAILRREVPEISLQDIETLYSISGGSAGQGLRILEEGGLEMIQSIITLLGKGGSSNWPAIHALADSLSRSTQGSGLLAFKEILLWITDSMVRSRAKGVSLPSVLLSAGLEALSLSYPLAAWVDTSDRLRDHFQTVDRANLDKRQAVLGSFMILNKDKRAA